MSKILIRGAKERRHVFQQRSSPEALQRGDGVRLARRVPRRFVEELPNQSECLLEIIDADEIVRVCDNRVGDVAPAQRIRFDVQQIGQQVVIEIA